MAEHTPGPWNYEWVHTLLRYSRKQVGPWDEMDGNHPDDKDANLIAAAPDLLAAAKAVLAYAAEIEHYPSTGNVYDELGAAVAKAEGEEHAEQRN